MRIKSNESDLKKTGCIPNLLQSATFESLDLTLDARTFHIFPWLTIPYLLELPDYCITKLCNCFALITPSKEVRNIDGRKEALNQAESLKEKPQAFPNKPIDSRWLAVIESHVDRECAASFLSPWATRNKLIEENVLNRLDLIYAKWKRWHKISWLSQDKRNCGRCIVSTIVLYQRRGQSPGRGTSRLKRVDVNAWFPSKHHPPLHLRTPLSVYTICIHWNPFKMYEFSGEKNNNTGPNIQGRNPHIMVPSNHKFGMNG